MALVQDITFGQYYPGESVVHNLDPRTKLLALLGILTFLAISVDWAVYLVFALFLGCVIAISGLPPGLVFRNLRPFLWLFLITFFLNLGYGQGRILWTLPLVRWEITDMALVRAVLYSVRIGLLIVFSAVFTLCTSPMEISDGIGRLLSPLKHLRVPVQELSLMMTIAIRFIPILLEEADRIRKAQMARGVRFDGNLIQRVRNLVPLIVPLFVSAFRKADDLALAMEARCYRIGAERTSFHRLQMGAADYLALAVVVIVGTGTLLVA